MKSYIDRYLDFSRQEAVKLIDSMVGKGEANPIFSLQDTDEIVQTRSTLTKYLNPILVDFNKSFRHICASPDRCELHISGYAFPYVSDLEGIHRSNYKLYISDMDHYYNNLYNPKHTAYVNANDKTVEGFCDYLIDLSKLEKSNEVSRNYGRVVFLLGEVGEGKSIFINYMTSVFMDKFNSRNTIVVKIDYTDAVKNGVDHLKERVGEKALRIVRDKYFERNIFNSKKLKAYLDTQEIDEKCKDSIVSYCQGVISDARSIQNISLYDAYILLRSFLKKEYEQNLVFIIDGLDNFHRDIPNRELFEYRAKELSEFVTGPEVEESCFLIVMRRESYGRLKQITHGGRKQRTDWGNVSLFPVDSKLIIKSKFDALKHITSIPREPNTYEIDRIEKINESRSMFSKRCSKFYKFLVEFIVEGIQVDHRADREEIFKSIFKTNRGLVHALNAICGDLLVQIELSGRPNDYIDAIDHIDLIINNKEARESFIHKYKWIVIRAMMVNGHFYALEPFDYEVESQGDDISVGPKATSDCDSKSQIPNIFHFLDQSRFSDLKDKLSPKSDNSHYLIKVRILQYYLYLKSKNGVAANYNEVSDVLEKMFGYRKSWVVYECRMLYSNMCLEKAFPTSESEDEFFKRRITSFGECLIKNILYKYEYIENILDNIVAEKEFCLKFFSPSVSVLKGQDLAKKDRELFRRQFGECLSEKIIRIISFLGYIERIDKLESDYFLESTGNKYFSFENGSRGNDLYIYNDLQESIVDTALKITGSKSSFVRDIVNRNIANKIDKRISGKNRQFVT